MPSKKALLAVFSPLQPSLFVCKLLMNVCPLVQLSFSCYFDEGTYLLKAALYVAPSYHQFLTPQPAYFADFIELQQFTECDQCGRKPRDCMATGSLVGTDGNSYLACSNWSTHRAVQDLLKSDTRWFDILLLGGQVRLV